MRMRRVLVCGSRSFDNYPLMKSILDKHYKDGYILIVSGGAEGADKLAERYAKENGLEMKIFEAEWHIYGKKAGPIRNEKMVAFADEGVAFWDENSPGTRDSIKKLRNAGKLVRVITGWKT
jgi:hypothetical protein